MATATVIYDGKRLREIDGIRADALRFELDEIRMEMRAACPCCHQAGAVVVKVHHPEDVWGSGRETSMIDITGFHEWVCPCTDEDAGGTIDPQRYEMMIDQEAARDLDALLG